MIQALIGNNPPNDQEGTDTKQTTSPLSKDSQLSAILLAQAALAGNSSFLFVWRQSFENALPTAQDLNCHSDVKNTIDFTLLDPSSGVIAEDIRRLVLASASDPAKGFDRLIDATKIIDYRHLVRHDTISAVEQTALVRAASFLVSNSEKPVNKALLDKLRGLSTTWCVSAKLLLTALEDRSASSEEEKELVAQVLSMDISKNGDVLSDQQKIALDTLANTGFKTLSPSTIETIVHILDKDLRGVDGFSEVVDWLRKIARYQPLPSSTVNFLLEELRKPEDDFRQMTAFNILAGNAHYLPKETLPELVEWARRNLATDSYVSDYAEGVGLFALVTNVGPEPALVFANRLVPEIPIPLEQEEETADGSLTIRTNDFKHGVALARLAQAMPLADTVVDRLSNFALARRGIPEYDQVIRGIAAQKVFQGTKPEDVRARLVADRSDARGRALDVELAAAGVQALESKNRQATLDSLRVTWSNESEAEIKIPLGEIIVKSTLRAIGIRLSDPAPCGCTDLAWKIGWDRD